MHLCCTSPCPVTFHLPPDNFYNIHEERKLFESIYFKNNTCLLTGGVYEDNKNLALAKVHRSYDKQLYKQRNNIERYFLRLKRFRKVFTRYDKLDSIFISTIYIAFIFDLFFMSTLPNISDAKLKLIESRMTSQPGQHEGTAKDNREFINAVVWILTTGSPWRYLPPNYGKSGTVHQKFIRWQRKGMWKKLFEILKGDKNFKWLMIDLSYVKAHERTAGVRGENQAISKTKGGSIRKYT